MKIINKLAAILWPLQRLMQMLGKKEPLITKAQVDKLISVIEPGDILLSYESQRFTSLFIKGEYDHAAIVTHDDQVVEAVYPRSRIVDLEQWLYNKDSVVVIRTNLPYTIRLLAGAYAKTLAFIEYDFSFSLMSAKLYCTELVATAYAKVYPAYKSKLSDNMVPVMYLTERDHAVVLEIKNH